MGQFQDYQDFLEPQVDHPSSQNTGTFVSNRSPAPDPDPPSSDRKQLLTIMAIIAVVAVFIGVSCLILFFQNTPKNSVAYEEGLPQAYEDTYRSGLLSACMCKIYSQTWSLAEQEGLDAKQIVATLKKQAEEAGYPDRIKTETNKAHQSVSALSKPSKEQEEANQLLNTMVEQLDILNELALHPQGLEKDYQQRYEAAYDLFLDSASQLHSLYPHLPDLSALESDIMFPIEEAA